MIDRERLVALLRDSAAAFLDSFRGTTPGQFHFKPAPDRWSIAETAEHVTVVETGSGKLIRGKLIRERASEEQLAATEGGEGRVDARLQTRDKIFPAPDFVLPTGRWQTPREMVAVFEEGRNATIDFLLATDVDLTRYAAPHPALGTLNGYQWAYFLVRHTERHLEQVNGVRRAPGFPEE
jgi:DinB superfamily